MTQAKKLEALVRKAVANGLQYAPRTKLVGISNDVDWILEGDTIYFQPSVYVDLKELLFNHDFARALFGNGKIEVYGGLWTKGMPKPTTIELHQVDAYLHHLQQAVVSDDPIGYMYKEVFGD